MVLHAFGIDIGGSGIKGAPVDLSKGCFAADRLRIPTPDPAKPKAIAKVCREIINNFDLPADCPVGVTLPAPIRHGVVPFIANLHKSWAGVNINEIMTEVLERPVFCVNDADAAGVAEVIYGAARNTSGVVIVTTLGTGIGTALICDGVLVPNSEIGHIEIDGVDAETEASAGAREREGLSFKNWAPRLQRYYKTLERLFSPDAFIVGGGVSRKHEKFLPLLKLDTPILPADLRNSAGIVGAAYLAAKHAGMEIEIGEVQIDYEAEDSGEHATVTAPED